MDDAFYMRQAIQLAEGGLGFVNPNPLVGAVIVRDGKVIGSGYHKKYGGPHAERNALASCAKPPAGATLYVTLEPCCHYGKTPPCTDAIIESGIARVVIGSGDPNPKVAGKGIELLREKGISVTTGVLEKECGGLNRVFFHYIKTGTPYVVMKYAMTLDGKIATRTGKSKWITGEAARENVHRSRLRYSAIMAGVGTVIADDPLLTCRLPGGRDPVRVICDTNLRIPLGSNIVRTAGEVPTYIVCCTDDGEKVKSLGDAGCRILKVPSLEGHVDLNALMTRLGEEKIDSVLLEGGAALNYSALKSGIVNKAEVYIAPKIFGGEGAKSPVGGYGADYPENAFICSDVKMTRFGEDILLEYEMR